MYWIQFQNIHTFTYKKTLLHTLFCLFLKSSRAFSVSLKASEKKHFTIIWYILWLILCFAHDFFVNFNCKCCKWLACLFMCCRWFCNKAKYFNFLSFRLLVYKYVMTQRLITVWKVKVLGPISSKWLISIQPQNEYK